jgi:hypothetical protein
MRARLNTAAIRQKLHNYLEVATDKKVKAIYTIIEDEIEETKVEYSREFKAVLDTRYAGYKNGRAKMITADESKKRLAKILKGRRKK